MGKGPLVHLQTPKTMESTGFYLEVQTDPAVSDRLQHSLLAANPELKGKSVLEILDAATCRHVRVFPQRCRRVLFCLRVASFCGLEGKTKSIPGLAQKQTDPQYGFAGFEPTLS